MYAWISSHTKYVPTFASIILSVNVKTVEAFLKKIKTKFIY